jgi:adenylate cyclase
MRDVGTEFRKLAAIMFTDMVGYSAMAQRNEALTLELLEEHRVIVRRILPLHNGDEIKTMGDAFLVEFPSALAAVRCAIEIQKEISDRNVRVGPERQVMLRIGIHLGDIVRRENDVVGDGVNIAARIEPMAKPGGICISEDVARQIQNKVNESLVRMGPGELKNIELPVVIYKLEPGGDLSGGTATFSKKAIRPPTPLESLVAFLRSARLAILLSILVISTVIVAVAFSARAHAVGPSLLVLPLQSFSSDKQDEHLSDGLTEELINSAARLSGLRVMSRSETFSYKGKNQSAIEVGKKLQVRHILAGSVRRAGDQVRVTIELSKASDGSRVWSHTFDGSISNAFGFETEIAQQVNVSLRDILAPEEAVGGIASLRAGFDP